MNMLKHTKSQMRIGVLLVIFLFVIGGTDLILKRISFTYASLRSSDLSGTSWWRLDLNNRNLSGYNLRGAVIAESDFINADFAKCDLTDARLRGAILSGANFKNAILIRTDFSMSDLSHVKLQGANLSEAKLNHAILAGADLTGAILKNADISNCRYDDNTKWPRNYDPNKNGAKLLDFPWPDKATPRHWGLFKRALNH